MTAKARSVPRTLGGAARSFFSFGSPRLLGLQLLTALAVRPFLGPPKLADAIILAAVLVYWPIQEWTAHKFILHAKPLRIGGRVIESGAARAHRLHHENPVDMGLSLLPTRTIAFLIPLHVGLWMLFLPPATACTGIACFGGATLVYEWIHFLTHTAWRARSKWFSEVKRRHMAHHQRDPRRWFAFAVPRLDDWLGTGDTPEPRTEAR